MSEIVHDRPKPETAGPPSVRIVEAIAAARGADSTAIEPLYGLFDLEAIDQLVANSRGDFRVDLSIGGVHVEVRGDGTVGVH